jgi:hypothetical protein
MEAPGTDEYAVKADGIFDPTKHTRTASAFNPLAVDAWWPEV